jgi:CDP-diacylglycerol---serine O-phosphatidyltransferase
VALNQASSWEMLLFTHTFHPVPYLAFLIPIFSAFRLAKFNIDARQAESFIGLPTPANTLLFLTIPLNLIYGNQDSLATMLLTNLFVLLGFTLLFSFLLVAEIPLLSIKFKNYSWKANKEKYLLLISSFIFLWFFNFLAPVFIIVLYLTLSLIHQKRQPKKNNP